MTTRKDQVHASGASTDASKPDEPTNAAARVQLTREQIERCREYGLHGVAKFDDRSQFLITLCDMALRYSYLRSKLYCADFRYGDEQECVLVFKWPHSISGDLDASIDAVLASASGTPQDNAVSK
jgi:hypothetical protein